MKFTLFTEVDICMQNMNIRLQKKEKKNEMKELLEAEKKNHDNMNN